MLNVKTSLRRFKRRLARRTGDGNIRLHLGSGQDYWADWVNIDSGKDAICDLQTDFTNLRSFYPDGSVSEIAMIHSLSYLRLWQARELFTDLYALLKQGGQLILELPDLSKCARKLLEGEGDVAEYLEGVRGIYAFSPEYIENRKLYTPYPFGWTAWHLKLELEAAGFNRIVIADPQTHGLRSWRDVRIEATK
jgi:hypothetical protein